MSRGTNNYIFKNNNFTGEGVTFATNSGHRFNSTNTTNLGTLNFGSGSSGSAYIYNYLDVHVNDSSDDLENASVTAWDKNGTQEFSILTNTSGDIPRQTLLSYWINDTDSYYYTNFTINTTKLTYSTDSQELNLTSSTKLYVTLPKGNLSVQLISPLNTWVLNDTVIFECSYSNSIDMNNISLYINNSGWTINKTESISSKDKFESLVKTKFSNTYSPLEIATIVVPVAGVATNVTVADS